MPYAMTVHHETLMSKTPYHLRKRFTLPNTLIKERAQITESSTVHTSLNIIANYDMSVGVCSTKNCEDYETCKEVDGKAVCECPPLDSCPRDVKVVCGSDGKSYLNKCRMKLEACKKKKAIVPRHDGICSEYLVECKERLNFAEEKERKLCIKITSIFPKNHERFRIL